MRQNVKDRLEAGLVWSGLPRVIRLANRSRVLVLAYHGIVPDGLGSVGDASLHLPLSSFRAQLDALVETHDVVSLHSLRTGTDGKRLRPRAVITFDDAYRGAVTLGVSELASRGLPATIFVAPGFVGGAAFWWDCLGNLQTGEVPPPIRRHALHVLGGIDSGIKEWATKQKMTLQVPPKSALPAGEAELEAAAAHRGISFGSHTWGHPNLTALGGQHVREELERPLTWLRERFENVVPWISYPYGLTSPEVERAAVAAGYESALRVDGGWLPRVPMVPFTLPRFNVPSGLSRQGFRIRIDGLFCT